MQVSNLNKLGPKFAVIPVMCYYYSMPKPELREFPISEFNVFDPIDPSVLQAIQDHLEKLRAKGQETTVIAAFDNKQSLIGTSDKKLVDAFHEISESIEAAQRLRGSIIGKTTLHAALLRFNGTRFFPWHSDMIADAFVTATQASTEGLSGTIMAENPTLIERAILEAAEIDQDLAHINTVKIVRPEAGLLINLPEGVVHRSPAAPEGIEDTRLIVNGVVIPSFLSTVFG